MGQAKRVDPGETRRKVEAGEALLVCAYDDEEKCRQLHLQGAMDLKELEEQTRGNPQGKGNHFLLRLTA